MRSVKERVDTVQKSIRFLKACVSRNFQSNDVEKQRLAASLLVLIETGCRPGTRRYSKENKTYGLTTLEFRHISMDSKCVFLNYVGKKQIRQRREVCDQRLVKWIQRARRAKIAPFTSATILRDVLRQRNIKIKDIRTWKANIEFRKAMKKCAKTTCALKITADVLGNTPSTLKKSYVDTNLL